MRTWTKSACVVLAWTILSITLVTAGMKGSVHPAQATMRTASSTEDILTSTLTIAAPSVTASAPATRYVVQPGDTLSGIAARFAVRGGWPALYTLNLQALGRDPNAIRPGTVLTVPGRAPVRYTVAAGDTLSGIAAGLGVHGGWSALYAANQRTIGPDPNAIRPGTVLTVPRPAAAPPASASASGRGHPRHPAPPPTPPAAPRHHPRPVARAAPAAQGMPQWLKTMLLMVGLLILVALLVEPVLVARRRHRQRAAVQPAQSGPAGSGWRPGTVAVQGAGSTPVPGLHPAQPSAEKGCIVLADHDRLVVTCNQRDNTVYVLRPPGEDPKAILRVARLVLPEGRYGELATQLGMPAIGPVE
ncbi:MAG: LysM peptidoglycan-binding domain-containing protein [Streptosporangiaceae bacterium]